MDAASHHPAPRGILGATKANSLAPYTEHGDDADAAVQLRLDGFIRTLASTGLAASIASVLLAGSHARGQAAPPVGLDATARFASDFDLYIVTRTRISRRSLETFVAELAAKLADSPERFRVDLHVLSLSELRRTPPVIRYVDLRIHGKLLAGEEARHHMPPLSARDLPAYEGLRRMLNAAYFFFENAAAGAPEPDLLLYLYGEAASAFAIAAGAHGQDPPAALQAIAGSPFRQHLESRIRSYCPKLAAGLAYKWERAPDATPFSGAWETALRDYVAMADIYSECVWGYQWNGRDPAERLRDGDAAALRTIARDSLQPYTRHTIRQWTGIDLAVNSIPVRFSTALYRILTNLPVLLGAPNTGLPAAADPTVQRGLKIYWAGRQLLERVSPLGRKFASTPAVAREVECFMRLFQGHFLGDRRTRIVLECGAGPRPAAAT